jgi:hypothetical protein
LQGVIKWFFAKSVTGGEQFLFTLIPKGEGEHAVEMIDTVFPPMVVCGGDDFGIAGGSEIVSVLGEDFFLIRGSCRSRRCGRACIGFRNEAVDWPVLSGR